MTETVVDRWLEKWGYSDSSGIYRSSAEVAATHAYRPEIGELLNPLGKVRAAAVFDVDDVPAICFIADDGSLMSDQAALDRIRASVWNQNLISLVLVVGEREAFAIPVNAKDAGDRLRIGEANDAGPYSQRDVQSGAAFARHTEWFAPERRVDNDLLRNLHLTIDRLVTHGLTKLDAQYLMSQVLFISYLEHRDIVSPSYREEYGFETLRAFVDAKDRVGISKLLAQLKDDFNGDFLEPDSAGDWTRLQDESLETIGRFLAKTDIESDQQSLWAYDFSYIPVELISGIYESFLSEEKKKVGAYYTPRHLANLAVDQAFADSADILSERIFDGASGSGILLTTAYRRMLSYAEAKAGTGEPLDFAARNKILLGSIFGSDLSEAACRVTAFSLYLSMLEGLHPRDILDLQRNEKVKLPNLAEHNLKAGHREGDFFSDDNPHLRKGGFSLAISNPPWVEPAKGNTLLSDTWAAARGFKIPRRQVAGAFMLRVRDYLAPDGRACLILPVSVVAADTSRRFFRTWLEHYRLESLINFGDLRKILFSNAKQPCLVALVTPRPPDSAGRVPGGETFEYWVPKADTSFAFGRLTLHGSDRHTLHTQALRDKNELLTTYYWGNARDVALIANLRLHGTLDDMLGKAGPWKNRKGFHRKDASVPNPVSTKPLHKMRYLNAKRFHVTGPVLDSGLLDPFPVASTPTATKLPPELLEAFRGPKILFVDGMTSERTIRAAFTSEPCSFIHSLGMISGPVEDESLLRFTAAYLHSSLVQYLLLMTAYQVNFERERVTLTDVERLPFIHPEQHSNPKRANAIVKKVATITRRFERSQQEMLRENYDPRECDALILEYFGLSKEECARVHEVSDLIAPNLQPSSVGGLWSALQRAPDQELLRKYGRTLVSEFKQWTDARGGRGRVSVTINVNTDATCGPLGIVTIEPALRSAQPRTAADTARDDRAVKALLRRLADAGVMPMEVRENLYLATDALIEEGTRIHLVKPLVTRLWLRSEAYSDAARVVGFVLDRAAGETEPQ